MNNLLIIQSMYTSYMQILDYSIFGNYEPVTIGNHGVCHGINFLRIQRDKFLTHSLF